MKFAGRPTLSAFFTRVLIALFVFTGTKVANADSSYLSFPNHSQAKFVSSHSTLSPGQTAWVALHILLEPEWHTYWENPGDSGAAFSAEMRGPAGIQFGNVEWPVPLRISTPPLTTYGYESQVLFRAPVTVSEDYSSESLLLEWEAEWLVCKIECIPAVHTFELKLPVRGASQKSPQHTLVMEPNFQRYPETGVLAGSYEQQGGQILVSTAELPQEFDFFPDSTLKISTDRPTGAGSIFRLQLKDDLQGDILTGLLLNEQTGSAQRLVAPPKKVSLLSFVFGAFLGGLILNLMPCVFPIISLKIFSALKESGSSREQRLSHLLFVLGVLISFFVIAVLLVGLKAAGHSLGWGFQLQSPLFVLFLVVLFFVLSLNFLGVFEFNIPILNSSSGSSGPLSSVLSGALAVLVASPCTAPFMGAALGVALSQSTTSLMAIFLGLGLGFSFPYILLAVFPALLSRVPRSGPWLKTFKEFMFFPMVWTALWLLWIYAQLTSSTSAIWVLASLSCGSGLFWWRSKAKSKFTSWVGSAVFLFAAATSLWLSVEAPQDSLPAASTSAFKWEPFDEQTLEELLDQGNSVFIDFTASWCLTCKVNERITFSQPEVAEFIQSENIHMIKADWTRRDPRITTFLERYGRISVPFYLYWPSGVRQPLILPEILTPQIFMNQIKNFQSQEGEST